MGIKLGENYKYKTKIKASPIIRLPLQAWIDFWQAMFFKSSLIMEMEVEKMLEKFYKKIDTENVLRSFYSWMNSPNTVRISFS